MDNQLTKYPEGSIRELWTIAYPMILAFLSGNTMMFADRLYLANYSTAAMNAAAAAGIIVTVFQYGFATITSIAEVLVGQFNGAKEYRRTAAPTWQMLWFSLGIFVLFFGIAKWGGRILLPEYHYEDHGLPYFQWLLFFGAATPAIAALSGFFIGIGQTRYVMLITIGGNLLNIILDPILIFGFGEVILPMGTKGAAIATGISLISQLALFFAIFLNHRYRGKYGTSLWKFEAPLFFKCLKVGLPNAVGHMIEWTAWAVSIKMMAGVSENHLTVAAIGQSLYALVAFGFEGVQTAVTTIAANRIGSGNASDVWAVWKSSIKLLLISAIPFGIVMLGFPDPIIAEFLSTESPPSEVILLIKLLRITAAGIFLYYLVDGFTWLTVGILTAAEDTWFIMWVNAVTAWVFGLLPIVIFMMYLNYSPAWYFFIISFYGFCNGLIFFRRLCSEPWKNLSMQKNLVLNSDRILSAND